MQLRHFSLRVPHITIDDDYAIQRAWLALKLAEGRVVRGRKIGLTSCAIQQAAQIIEPDFAPLLDDMFFEAGSDIPYDRFIAPRVEVELAFVLSRFLEGPHVTLADVVNATDVVMPAVEIIDARIEQFDRQTQAPRKVFDTNADFAANAGIVTGGRPVRPGEVDLRWVCPALQKRRDRGDRAGRRRARPPGDWSRVARQQDRVVRQAFEREKRRAPARSPGPWLRLAATRSTSTTAGSARSRPVSSEPSRPSRRNRKALP